MRGLKGKTMNEEDKKKATDTKKFLRTGQVVELLGVSRMTISRMVRSGTLPAIRLQKQYQFDREAVDRWLEERRTVAA